MAVRCRRFALGFAWKRVVEEVCAFAAEIGRERLISINHSFGAVFVYYWE
jgi:hypothetical protein